MADRTKILCIEDESEMIDLMRFILEREGFDFVGAQGGLRGLDAAREEKPDLILLDLMMPDIDGWEVYRQLKADRELRHIPVLVVTARAQSIDRVVGLNLARVDGYITKPFSLKELLDSIHGALHIEARS